MIRTLLISCALATWPLAGSAELLAVEPDCAEGGVNYVMTETLAPGLRFTTAYDQETGEEYELLILCASGMAVRAEFVGSYEIDFYALSAKLAQSEQTYTLEEVAKLARESGFDASVMAVSSTSCVCKLDR